MQKTKIFQPSCRFLLFITFFVCSLKLSSQVYNRSSLSIFYVQYSDERPFATSLLKTTKFPDKFDRNDIGQNTIQLNKSFGSYASTYDIQEQVKRKIQQDRIPNRILRSILVDESLGYMTVKKLQQRGEFNAKDADVVIAKNSARGLDAIKDKGVEVLNRVYFLVITPTGLDNQTDNEITTATIYKLSYQAVLYQIDVDYNKIFSEFWFDQKDEVKMDKLMNYPFDIKEVSNQSLAVANTNMDGLAKTSKLLSMINNSISIDLTSSSATNLAAKKTGGSSSETAAKNSNTQARAAKTETPATSNYFDSIRNANSKKRVEAMQERNREDNLKAAAGAVAIIGAASLMHDHYSEENAYMKFLLGLGWDEIPIILNTENKKSSATGTTSHPTAQIGFKLGLLNRKGVSLQLTPTFSYGLNVAALTPGTAGNHITYGGTGTILFGKKQKSMLKFFGEFGYQQRSGDYTYDEDVATDAASTGTYTNNVDIGEYSYTTVKYGGGVMLHFISGDEESYIKPGIFWEKSSFAPSGSKPVMVANLQFMVSSFIMIDCSYSKNYYIAGTTNYVNKFTADDQNYFSIRVLKTGHIF